MDVGLNPSVVGIILIKYYNNKLLNRTQVQYIVPAQSSVLYLRGFSQEMDFMQKLKSQKSQRNGECMSCMAAHMATAWIYKRTIQRPHFVLPGFYYVDQTFDFYNKIQ